MHVSVGIIILTFSILSVVIISSSDDDVSKYSFGMNEGTFLNLQSWSHSLILCWTVDYVSLGQLLYWVVVLIAGVQVKLVCCLHVIGL